MSHMTRMLLACLVPLSLIFLLPLFGVGSGVTLFAFLILMFVGHLFMMGGHGHGGHGGGQPENGNHQAPLEQEESTHEHHERDTVHQRHQH